MLVRFSALQPLQSVIGRLMFGSSKAFRIASNIRARLERRIRKMLKSLTRDETFSNTLDVLDDDTVSTSFTVKPSNDSPLRYVLNWKFDFTGCTRNQLLRLAASSFKITMQAAWRREPEQRRHEATLWDNITISVADQLAAKPAKQSAAAKLEKLAKQLSPEQKQAMIDQLLASIAASESDAA